MTPQEVAAAFDQVDRLREAALEAAPSVAALLRHGRALGMPEGRLAKALGMSPPASYWCANLPPAKGRDALLAEPEHPSGAEVGALILRWATGTTGLSQMGLDTTEP